MQRVFFPQDAIWQAANEVNLKLLKIDSRWCVEFSVVGIIGRDPFDRDDDEDDDDEGGLAEPREEIDPAELVRAIVADLTSKKAKQV